MAACEAAFDSPYYPYEKVQTGFNTLRGAEEIPAKILRYLLDLPDWKGYQPVDDNSRPRVRLAKYLYYDDANPLSYPLPSPQQKLSLLYDGDQPVVNTDEEKVRHPKGYRLYPQMYWGQSQLEAQTTVKCYIGRVLPVSEMRTSIGLSFVILCNTSQENNTRTDAYSRAYDIEQCIIEALHGVNLSGIGVVEFSRPSHFDNGSEAIADQGTNVGRELHMSISWMESGGSEDGTLG